MLAINPDECIDCGVCEPECPAEAIRPDMEPDGEKWAELNREFSLQWPNLTKKLPPPDDADGFKDVAGKYEKFFTATPGRGNR